MQEVYEYLKKCGVFFVATEEGDQARVRPFGALNIFQGKLYLITAKSKNVSKQIAANPKAEICACNGRDWLRVTATLVDDNSMEAQQSMLDANPGLKSLYQAGDGNTQTLYLKDAVAVFYTMGSKPKTVKF